MVDVLEQQDLYELENKVDDLAGRVEYIINHLCRPEYEYIVYQSYNTTYGGSYHIVRFEHEDSAYVWLRKQFTPTGKMISKNSWLYKKGWKTHHPDTFKIKEVMKNYYTDVPYWAELSLKDE